MQKKQQYSFQVEENNRAAGNAYYKNNVALTRIQDRAKGDALDSFIQLMEANAADEAKGQTGRRSGMRRQSNLMTRGIEMRSVLILLLMQIRTPGKPMKMFVGKSV